MPRVNEPEVYKFAALVFCEEFNGINNFEPGAWSMAAILVSTVAFTLGHQVYEWPAAILYGFLMVFLWISRKDLISCIVAHGTTNFALALYVYLS
jgi:membrane protease YdiL (CAAX protease family)